jgi:hypothetical protein
MAGSGSPRRRLARGPRCLRRSFDVRGVVPALFVFFVVICSCSTGVITEEIGTCLIDTGLACPLNLIGYSCTGSLRPDENPSLSRGIQGIVCADQGPLPGMGEGYCCTGKTTTCAYDTSAVCPATDTGYSCLGPNRPDAFDPTLSCGQGVPTNGLVVYCCGTMVKSPCMKDSNIPCATGTVGFKCTATDAGLPTQGDLGTDESRSDALLVCSVPTPDQLGGIEYCCFTPTQEPIGATCLQDQSVPKCAGGSWGFACTGPDTPDQDFPRIACNGAAVRGVNQTGISAMLYCCNYEQGD